MNIDLYSTYHNKQAYVLACRIYSNKVGWLLLAPTSYPSNNENASLSFHAKYYDSNFFPYYMSLQPMHFLKST